MASIAVRVALVVVKWVKAHSLRRAIDGEAAERLGDGAPIGTKLADGEFSPEEEASAFETNKIMSVCQIGISVAQGTVCAVKFAVSPVRNTVNICCCALGLPLAVCGITALNHPTADWAVPVMHVYQYFFVVRSALVTFDYAWLLGTRKTLHPGVKAVVLATVLLVVILTLQVLNSLLVMAVIRIMRKKYREGQAAETTPLLTEPATKES